MARKKTTKRVEVENYSHNGSSRKNIPPAKIAGEGKIPKTKKAVYSYSPHLTPDCCFDTSGNADRVADIVKKACSGESLSAKEQGILHSIAKNVEHPWLEWAGKAEEQRSKSLVVDPVALHIHERISSNAIVRTAMRQDVQRDLFADPEQDYQDAVQFYRHDIDWANRLILGDSMQVMSSLARREDLVGKVQMVYIDPPYGIKFASNFQPEVGKRDVKNQEADLTREPEMVKAYRDTWHLGIHSYLSYLRDRLIIAKELLSESGSIFVQIGDENVHRVRQIMDEVFGADNFITEIAVKKTAGLSKGLMPEVVDYVLWFARKKDMVLRRTLFTPKEFEGDVAYRLVEDESGFRHPFQAGELPAKELAGKVLRYQILLAAGRTPSCVYPITAFGGEYLPTAGRSWSTNPSGMKRLIEAERIVKAGATLNYVRYGKDNPMNPLQNLWADTASGSGMDKVYVVQTNTKLLDRCILMTTDPGDIVLDPTCGSGTTAYSAEKWGRRWITIDASRVSVAIARQRLLAAKFERYRINSESLASASSADGKGVDPSAGFVCRTVPHITLASIARNENLDPIILKHKRVLENNLTAINRALSDVTDALRQQLVSKLAMKMQEEGVRSSTEADRRRWLLPGTSKAQIDSAFAGKSKLKAKHVKDHFAAVPPEGKFEHWQVPFDADSDWPESLIRACNAPHYFTPFQSHCLTW